MTTNCSDHGPSAAGYRAWGAGILAMALSLGLGACASTTPSPERLLTDKPTAAGVLTAASTQAPPESVVSPSPEPIASADSLDRETIPPILETPIDPLAPDAVIDLLSQEAHADLWVRLRKGFVLEDLDTDLVRKHEQWYASRADYVQRMTQRGSRYLYHIVEEVERRQMPSELALLPFIESAFNPQALSSAKASGIWQFMSATGKDFDLTQNVFRDDRRDVLESTRAALDYLQRLHRQFGDWHLALAAYNWGQGNVQRAIDRNRRAGLPTDYLGLRNRMPAETQNYVPKLQAVKNIVDRPREFGLSLPEVKNHPYFLAVPIQRDMDVALAAQFSGMPSDEFHALNPQLNKPVILAAGTPRVLLPFEQVSAFNQAIEQHSGPLATWTAWVAPKTLKTSDAAKLTGMSENQLREVNRIPKNMQIKAGSTLLVARSAYRLEDVPEHIADTARVAFAPEVRPARKVSFKAKKGATVQTVARQYKLTPQQVAQWNQLSTKGNFRTGQTVVLYLPPQPAKSAPRSKPTRVATAAKSGSSKASPRAGNQGNATRYARADSSRGTTQRESTRVALKQ